MPAQVAEWWKTKGKCKSCGKFFSKAGITRHLSTCLANRSDNAGKRTGKKQGKSPKLVDVFHLVVESAHHPAYWMHLEMESKATLDELDAFLRYTWLECCGHCSAFQDGDTSYTDMEMEWGENKPMTTPASWAFQVGKTLGYEYDFGSTTELKIKAVEERTRETTGDTIALLARNTAPKIPCGECDAVATSICPDCSYDASGWLCKKCMKKHERECEGGEMALPVVNSPRTGVCAYVG